MPKFIQGILLSIPTLGFGIIITSVLAHPVDEITILAILGALGLIGTWLLLILENFENTFRRRLTTTLIAFGIIGATTGATILIAITNQLAHPPIFIPLVAVSLIAFIVLVVIWSIKKQLLAKTEKNFIYLSIIIILSTISGIYLSILHHAI